MKKMSNFTKILICLLIIFLLLSSTKVNNIVENFTSKLYYHECSNNMPKILEKVTNDNGMVKTKNVDNYDIYMPCSYNNCELKSRRLKPKNEDQKFYLFDGCDTINSKIKLWNCLLETYGRKEASEIMPNTFILNKSKEVEHFKNHFKNKKNINNKAKYVLKNNKQRQEGIKLSSNLNDILEAKKNNFLLVQDYIENPFIISKRKINIRYYLLIICTKKFIRGYIYEDGFLYYTPKFYKEGTLNFDEHITTGYIDRQVYIDNPLTITDFNDYLKKVNRNYPALFFDRVKKLFWKVMNASYNKICKIDNLKNNTLFQVFGADIAPDKNLFPMLMEINKGPDISAKDDRDGKVKLNMHHDLLDIVDNDININEINKNNKFHLIFENFR